MYYCLDAITGSVQARRIRWEVKGKWVMIW